MADVVVFTTDGPPQLIKSVNTVDYCDIPENKKVYSEDGKKWGVDLKKNELEQYSKNGVVINPNLNNVKNVPIKYWKKVGKTIVEMNQAEKDAVDLTYLSEKMKKVKDYNVSMADLIHAFFNLGIVKKEQFDAALQEAINGNW